MDGHEDQEENHTMADEKSCDGMEQGRKRSWGRAPSGHTLSSCLSLDIGRLLTQQTLPPHPGQPPPWDTLPCFQPFPATTKAAGHSVLEIFRFPSEYALRWFLLPVVNTAAVNIFRLKVSPLRAALFLKCMSPSGLEPSTVLLRGSVLIKKPVVVTPCRLLRSWNHISEHAAVILLQEKARHGDVIPALGRPRLQVEASLDF